MNTLMTSVLIAGALLIISGIVLTTDPKNIKRKKTGLILLITGVLLVVAESLVVILDWSKYSS